MRMSMIEVDLPEGLDDFIRHQVASGLYADAADVVRAALRRLAQDEDDEAKLAALREALRPGIAQADAAIHSDRSILDIARDGARQLPDHGQSVRYRLTPEADDHVVAIRRDTAARWGEAQAIRYLEDLHQRLELAIDLPGLMRPRPELGRDLHAIRAQSHVAYVRWDAARRLRLDDQG